MVYHPMKEGDAVKVKSTDDEGMVLLEDADGKIHCKKHIVTISNRSLTEKEKAYALELVD